MSRSRARRAGSRRGRAGVGGSAPAGSRTRGSRWSRPGPAASTSRRRGVERLYGGLERRSSGRSQAVGAGWDAKAGAAERRFAALAAASVARPGQALVVADDAAGVVPRAAAAAPAARLRRDARGAVGARRPAGSGSSRRCRAVRSPNGSAGRVGVPGHSRTGGGARGPRAVGLRPRSWRCSSSPRRSGTSSRFGGRSRRWRSGLLARHRARGALRAEAGAVGTARRRGVVAAHGDAA